MCLSVSHDRPITVRGKSRLVREDEHDKSDEEEEEEDELGTMTFGSRKEPGRQMQVGRERQREREREERVKERESEREE